MNLGDVNDSLRYTPSPARDADESDETQSLSSQSEERVVTNLFSIRETESISRRGRKSENSCSQKSTARSETSTACRSQQSTVVVKPFSNIIGDYDTDSAKGISNTSNSSLRVPASIRLFSDKQSIDSKLSVSNLDNDTSSLASSNSLRMQHVSNRGRGSLTSVRSETTNPTTKKMHATDPKSDRSVNPALNAARQARERAIKKKANAAASIREQWKEEKDEALDFNEELEKLRREQLNLQTQLSSQFSRTKASRNHKLKHVKWETADKESNFKSMVAREQQRKLKEQEDKRRRQSTAVRAKIRVNNRQGEEKLQLMRIEEEQAILEERQLSSKAHQQYKRERANSARKSFLFRAGDARRIRELHNEMESQRKTEQHESSELMLNAARDADEYHSTLAEQRRQSLAFRNAEAAEQRKKEEGELSKQKQAENASYELKRAAESDVDKYKRQQEEERRASFEFRNREGHQQRQLIAELNAKNLSDEQKSLQLKFDGDKDAEAYLRNEAELRRKSLAQRNLIARNIRTWQSQEESKQLQQEQQSLELKHAGEKDAEEYHRKMDEMRRQSLAQRNEEAARQSKEEEGRQEEAAKSEHESYELKWSGERDAEAYQRHMEEERRKSLNNRNFEALNQRKQADGRRAAELQAEQENLQLKRAAEKDVEEYREKTARQERERLAFRNQERARHAKVMEELCSLAKEEESASYELKWGGENDAKEYKARIEEERRKSLQLRNEEWKRHRSVDDETRQQELVEDHKDEVLKADGKCKETDLNLSRAVAFSL